MKGMVIGLIVVLIVVGGIIFMTYNQKENSYKKITIDEMYNLNNNGVILDVRTLEEYSEGHLLNSLNVPLDQINTISEKIGVKEQQIFVYCKSGVRSEEAALKLIEMGYTNVYDLGGIDGLDVELVK